MIQTQTHILIKDNSDYLNGKCVNKGWKKTAGVGNVIKISISKVRSGTRPPLGLVHGNTKKKLHDILIIQTKKPLRRKDGASLECNCNSGVGVVYKKGALKKQHQLGFKRINTTVPFELKHTAHVQKFKGAYNVIKLAKNLF
jgi:ribosomal protein L14